MPEPAKRLFPYFAGFLLGTGDSCFNVLSIAVIGSSFEPNETTAAFAVMQFIQSAGSSLLFVLAPSTPLRKSDVLIWIVVASAMINIATFGMARIDRRASKIKG